MANFLMFAGALLAQSTGTVADGETTQRDYVEVAYEEMRQGHNEAAIARINRNAQRDADDPAALINIGTAHARMGRESQARKYFMRALASRERYDLELANGQWMDSRRAARKAVELLGRQGTFAIASREGR